MVVRGLTNRRPDDNTVFVDVVAGPSAGEFDVGATDAWQTDGVWSVTLAVPRDAEPGTYTIEADDGDDTDAFQVAIRPARGNADDSDRRFGRSRRPVGVTTVCHRDSFSYQ